MSTVAGEPAMQVKRLSLARLIVGAAAGTVFEWYDFFLYGSVATILTSQFFAGVGGPLAFIFALLTFAAGFAVRPLGAVIFGRLGDRWGRKNTFLVTMILMGVSTFAVGLLPTFKTVGALAPMLLVLTRLAQGLAVGGEYGGAAVYIAEHSPPKSRGFNTSFIQVTCTLGIASSLLVVLSTRLAFGEAAFVAWAWRLPFFASAGLLAVSLWIRLQLEESPAFREMAAAGDISPRPLSDTFGSPTQLRGMALAIFGLTAGMTATFYNSQIYAQFFLEKVLGVDGAETNKLVVLALAIASPFFIFFGWLSDRVGRKPLILLGCLLAATTYFPLFKALTEAANPALAAATARAPVTVFANPGDCSFQLDLVTRTARVKSCDIAKNALAVRGVSYANQSIGAARLAEVHVGAVIVSSFDGERLPPTTLATQQAAFNKSLNGALVRAGYPARADPVRINRPLVVGILVVMVLYVTMTYGPLAAILVEMFPTRIRYTAVSFSYNLAVGWLGGFLAPIAFAMVVANGNIYFGLWYAVSLTIMTFVIGLFFINERWGQDLKS